MIEGESWKTRRPTLSRILILIETARLILRRYTAADFECYRAMISDPAVYRSLGGVPLSREDAWNRLLRYEGHWSLFGYGLLAVIERETLTYIGNTGIADFGRAVDLGLDHADEAAWIFTSASQGRGLALEAARAAHAWYDEAIGRRTICLIADDNSSSVRLATHLGYDPFTTIKYRGTAMSAFERSFPTPSDGVQPNSCANASI